MIVKYGRTCPEGFLPVFSVNTEDEAKKLLILVCPRNENGEFVAPELAREQTLDNLWAFGDKLERAYGMMTKLKKAKA